MTNATTPAAFADRLFSLEGKLAVVTGASQGIGLAIAECLASAGADIIGVNSRDLRTLTVDMRLCDALIEEAPPGAVMIAESGIRSRDDIDRLVACGYGAFLIGERLMTAPDPGAALSGLLGPASGGGRTAASLEA